MSLSLRQLQAFNSVASLGSVTGAAAQLDISQPAVSRLLSSFGNSVGFTLFTRHQGRLEPTPEARYLLTEVRQVLEGLQRLETLKRDIPERTAGHLRIACLPGFATSHLPKVLSQFLESKPGVTITLEPDRPERIMEWIIGEQYDCGITDGRRRHPATESKSYGMRTVCIFPKGHLLGEKTEIWPEDIAGERLIHTRRDSAFFKSLEQAFSSRGVKIPTWIEIRQFTAACTFVSQGNGVSVVSELDAVQFLDKNIDMRPFRPVVPHTLSVVRPITTSPSIITLEFIEAFVASILPYVISEPESFSV